jgi:hypothetical protein
MRKLTWTFAIAAVAAAVQLAYAADPRAPYDQLEIDLALPQIPERTESGMVGDSSRAPYDQLDIDRAVPQFPEPGAVTGRKAVRGAPYDQLEVDRALPQFPERTGSGVAPAPESQSTWDDDEWQHDD